MQNLLDLSVSGIMWWSFGWGIAFGVESDSGGFNQFVGPGSFFARGEEFEDDTGNFGTTEGYSWALWLFQVRHTHRILLVVNVLTSTSSRRDT